MYNYYERTYYTLDELGKDLGYSGEGPYSLINESFNGFINGCLKKVGYNTVSFNDTQESNNCFRNYIWPRFYQEAIIYVDSDESESFIEKFCRTKVGQIMA